MTAGKQSLMGSSGANYRHHEISFFFFSFFLKKIKHFFYLVLQHLGAGLLCLLLVDELHEDSLVLEHVALGLQVELVVQVTVDLLGLPAECHNVKLINFLAPLASQQNGHFVSPHLNPPLY